MAVEAERSPAPSAASGAARRLTRLLAIPGRDPYALAGIAIYVVFLFVAIFVQQLAPHDPLEILFRANGRVAANMRPGADFLLGTTNLGRDVFSQLIHGARNAAIVGLSAAIVVVAVGTLVGLVS